MVAVATIAGLAGRRACIQPKRNNTSWAEVPNLWGGIVAEPGEKKSPIIPTNTAPARELEGEWHREHEAALQAYQSKTEAADLRLQAWKKEAANPGMRHRLAQATHPPAPTQKRLIASDATFGSMQALLATNPGGFFVLRDELAGWLAGLERQGREQERTFCLEFWRFWHLSLRA